MAVALSYMKRSITKALGRAGADGEAVGMPDVCVIICICLEMCISLCKSSMIRKQLSCETVCKVQDPK